MSEHRLTETDTHNARAPFVLALDIGTSSVRAALYDARGGEISGTEARIVRSLNTTQDGGAELDADAGIAQVAHTLDALLTRTKTLAPQIEAIAVSCFWHSLVGVDKTGRAVTPVYSWADTRAAAYAGELRRRFNEAETHARTGCMFHASYWPAKLLWLRAEQPEIYERVTRWMSFADYLALRLFGDAQTSVSMASGTGLLNQKSCEWDAELTKELQLDIETLPAIAVAGAAFTNWTNEYAKRWPQLKNVRSFPAIGDGAANNIGANCTNANRAALMIGTSGAMRVMFEGAPPSVLPESLWCYRADQRRILIGGALSDGGGLYGWMKEALALNALTASVETEAALEAALEQMMPDAHGLTLMPFWAGERSTGWHAEARGAILGLRLHTRPLDILRAAMEAVCYRFALIAAALNIVMKDATNDLEIIASGGALVNSPVWTQMLADVLNLPVRLSTAREASGRGAALLALEAMGKISIKDMPVEFNQTYVPDAARHTSYCAGLERQQKIYAHLIANNEVARIISEAVPQEIESLRRNENAAHATSTAPTEERSTT